MVAGPSFPCVSRMSSLIPMEENIFLAEDVFLNDPQEYNLVPLVFPFGDLVMKIYHGGSSRKTFLPLCEKCVRCFVYTDAEPQLSASWNGQ